MSEAALLADAIRTISWCCRAFCGKDAIELLELYENERTKAALAVTGPVLRNVSRARN